MKKLALFFALFSFSLFARQTIEANFYTDVNMQGHVIRNLHVPVEQQDAATKKYVDDAVTGGGDIVTDEILENRLSSYDASIKDWAGDQHTSLEQTIEAWASGQLLVLDSALRTWALQNFLPSEPVNIHLRGDLHADGNAAVDGGLIVGSEIDMTGGRIRNLQGPVEDGDAVTKGYVSQNYLKLVGGRMEGEINMAGLDGDKHRIINLADFGTTTGDNRYNAVNKHYVDDATNAVVGLLNGLYLPLSGGTMSGAINMNNYRVANLPSPLFSSDAATKSYVDARYNESLDFYYFDGFVFSSSPTDFSSRTFDFSFPTNSTSGVVYAKILGCGTRYTKLGWLIKSPSHDSSDFSTSVSTVSGRGYDPGDVLAFHISTLFPLEYDSRFTATFQVYDDNHSSSACLVTFTGLPSPPTPPPLPDFDFSIELGSYVYPLDPFSSSHIDFPSSSISGDSYNFTVLITPTSSFSGSVPYTIDFDPVSRVSPSSSQGSISSSSSAEVFFTASASYTDSFHLRIRVDSFDVEADIMAQTPTPPEPPSQSEQ